MKAFRQIIILAFAVFYMVLVSSSALAGVIAYEITDKAELTKISMYMKKIRKKSTEKAVVFEVSIKNTDSVPHLYSVTVVMPGAGGAEGFIPAKGEKMLEPQKEGTTAIGIIWPKFPEDGYMIVVETVQER
jgi:uncharacterized membrane protein YcgQ (UPF0703/DUF1980 family)